MNAESFRHVYDYHFAENRKIWDHYVSRLSPEQFMQDATYSHGSIRKQILHLMSVDEAWFSGLRGLEPTDFTPEQIADPQSIRATWDTIESQMRDYLAQLRDEMLFEKPFADGEDKDLILWQVLLQVINHGTDHRAQILRLLHDLDIETNFQDYIFYAYATA